MEFLRRDADLGTKAKHKAIRETGRGIDVNRRRINFFQEALGSEIIIGDDRFGVLRIVAIDVSNGFF